MNAVEILALSGIMISLAAVPSTSVAVVVTRSAVLGLGNGIAVSAGIVLGDLVYVVLAISGLSVMAETMGSLFMAMKYLGALYLLWFGISLLKNAPGSELAPGTPKDKSNLITSFLAGFTLTLGDVKAIFFYISLFPVFVDLTALQVADILAILSVTVLSVGGVKIVYAISARKIAGMARSRGFESAARKTAGGLMIGTGGYIIAKA